MPKLTKEQKRFLIWLSLTGTHFEICRELGYSYRQMNGLERYVNKQGERYKFDTRTLQRLIDADLVTSKLIYPFGIKYQRYYVTEEGRACATLFRLGAS
jgi:hypothetical protein